MTRRTVAPGVYEDAHGFSVRWRDHGLSKEKRFPIDTPLSVLKAFRARQISQAQPAPDEKPGSFVRDVARFLKLRRVRRCHRKEEGKEGGRR